MAEKLLIITQKVDENDQLLGFFVEWLKEFAKHHDHIIVLCLEKGSFDLPSNIRVISLGKNRKESKFLWLWNFYVNCWRLRNEYDSVFVHMNPIWAVLGSTMWRIMHKKVVLWYTHKAVTLKLRIAEKVVSQIVTASKESFRIKSNKVLVVGHGIDIDLFCPDESKKSNEGIIRILSVGRITPIKGYETLIDAATILKNSGVVFSVTVIGEPAVKDDINYLESLKLTIKSRGLTDAITFVGKVVNRNLPIYYQSHNIFIHMSQTGSLDKSILEAMACGIKVVSSNDASRAFLPKGLTFSTNNPEDLAEKIRISDKVDFDGRQYVIDHHNLSRLVDTLSALL